ncbi:pirin family protein [Denitromonas sp. IR12]|uniref:Pirin family protein n=2 Tax=Denitromonas iodatirespirans TaxID=2795389 RepID=A0A944H6B0_DENI1|nr:pirin family protein [Denitromonas iodatirespirans]
MTIRKADDRGHARFGWLNARHTFSFGEYYDPAHMGFGPLRVINDDRIAPGGGFPTHPHADMEILTYVIDGALAHKDSLGNGSTIRPGEIQYMRAGTGIRHSEFNPSSSEPLRLLQIWVLPAERGTPPGYGQQRIDVLPVKNGLRLIASGDGRDGSVRIGQDVDLYAATLDGADTAELTPAPGRLGWVQVARGSVTLNGERLAEGDGAALSGETLLRLSDGDGAELLVFDMAP